MTKITDVAKFDKIVDYAFERSEKSNVIATHPTLPLLAYLINIKRVQKISKAWSSGNESSQSMNSPANGQGSSSKLSNSSQPYHNNHHHHQQCQLNQSLHKNVTLNLLSSSPENSPNKNDALGTPSIRIMDYSTRQRCLAKGIYHARPVDCAFTINSLICSHSNITKLAIVDAAANIYLYNLSLLSSDLTAIRIAVIRSPGYEMSPTTDFNLVWCPFVPCEDFGEGDGGLRLTLATDSKIEMFAVDRFLDRTGEITRGDLRGSYRCIQDTCKAKIVTLCVSPDCSTIAAAASDNRITFYSSDIDNNDPSLLHNWEANVSDKSSISRLFFLDNYPDLLKDSSMKFWGAAFIGTRSGQMLLVDPRSWNVYQNTNIPTAFSEPKNFDYRIDWTSHNIVAVNGNHCSVVQLKPGSDGLPKIVKITKLELQSPIYAFVIKHKSDSELDLFTISAFSLERITIDLKPLEDVSSPNMTGLLFPNQPQQPPPSAPPQPQQTNQYQQQRQQVVQTLNGEGQLDKLVQGLFNQLNTAFSKGLEEFLTEVRCEVNDLKSKLNGLSRDVRKLQQQLQDREK